MTVPAQAFDASPFPAIVSRLSDDVVVAVNAKACETVRRPAAEIVGRKVTEFYTHPHERTALVDRLQRDGTADDVLVQVGRAAGDQRWLRVSSTVITASGETCVLSVFGDVTEQVNAEQALRAS